MKNTSKTVIFFGNERLATGVSTTTPTLRALIESGYDVKAVVSNYDKLNLPKILHSPKLKSRNNRELEIANIANQNNIPLLLPDKLLDIKEQLKSYNASIGVLVAYGKLIPQEIIDIFPNGIINIHPSLLPKHRGSTPIETTILNGDKKTGVTVMLLTKEMDAGPIYIQKTIQLRGDESKQELANNLSELGKDLLLQTLPKILTNNIKPKLQSHLDKLDLDQIAYPHTESAQPKTVFSETLIEKKPSIAEISLSESRGTIDKSSGATYTQKLIKQNGVINWQKPAIQIEQEIRAYARWPGSKTILGGKEIIVTKAHVPQKLLNTGIKNPQPGQTIIFGNSLFIYCGDQYLSIDRLKPAGKKEMPISAFLAGYRQLL